MFLHHLRADVRYAIKWLARSPGFTAVAIASLAIGIGFNAALFSVIDALLLRPLPVDRPDRLVDVYTRGGDGDTYATSSYPDYLDFRNQNEVFTDVLAYSPSFAAVKSGPQSRMALAEVVTGNYFQLLGIRAAAGRTLLPDDDRSGAPRVVLLSDRVWLRDYGRDGAAIGRTMHIHGQAYTIVGVAPARFTGMLPMLQPDLWIPMTWVEEVEPAGIQDVVPSPTGNSRLERRGQRWLFVKGRLQDHETAARAQANLQLIMNQLAEAHPKTNTDRPVAVAANVRVHPDADRALVPVAAGLMLGVAIVLLVACSNVMNMLLARGSSRQREIGIRIAIGASRGRLIRQLLTEGVVLGLLGASVGVGVAMALLRVIEAVPLPIPIPLALSIGIDARMLAFAVAIAMLGGVIAALAPALRATRANVSADLKVETTSVRTAGRRLTLRDGLIVLQTAFTLVLLVIAALLTRSIMEARRVDLGFTPSGLAMVSTDLGLIGYSGEQASQLFERALERVRSIPGVLSVARASRQPLSINYSRQSVFFADRQRAGEPAHVVGAASVDAEYFQVLNVPLLRGRTFTNADLTSSYRVAIVNNAFVRRFWASESDPVGRRFRIRGIDGPEYEVVGVVADYKTETVGETARPYVHFPLTQRTSSAVVMARSASDAGALLAAIKRELLTLDPNVVFIEEQTMDAQVNTSLLPARLAAMTAVLVGLVATTLAAIGLYGVVAYAVSTRTREIGVRMALGAAPRGVVVMVMRQGLGVTAVGSSVGLILAWPAARAISSGFYGVGAFDPLAWSGATAILLASAVLANYVPARRASRVDPSVALRME